MKVDQETYLLALATLKMIVEARETSTSVNMFAQKVIMALDLMPDDLRSALPKRE